MRAVDDGAADARRSGRAVAAASGGARTARRHDSRPAGARVRADRVPAVLPRLHRPRRVRARHLLAAARVRAAIAVDLQRPRLHPARVHPRGRAAIGTGVHGAPGAARSVAQSRDAVPPAGLVRHRRAAHVQSAARLASAHRADGGRRAGAAGCSSAKSTTRTRGRSAAPPATRASSARPPRSAPSPARCCGRSPASRSLASPETMRDVHHAGRTCPAARARSAGTRCCRPRRAARSCRPPSIGHTGFTGHVALDRLGARSLRRAPDQPRAPDADQRSHPKSPAPPPRRHRRRARDAWVLTAPRARHSSEHRSAYTRPRHGFVPAAQGSTRADSPIRHRIH